MNKKALLKALVVLIFSMQAVAQNNTTQASTLHQLEQNYTGFGADSNDLDNLITDVSQLPDQETIDHENERQIELLESGSDILNSDSQKYLEGLQNIPEYYPIDGEDVGVPELQSDAIKRINGEGLWGFQFLYMNKSDKSVKVLSQNRIHQPIKPASTLKIFTGWLAFLNGTYPKPNLNVMLRRSDNAMADQALRSVAKKMNPALKGPNELLDFGVDYMKKHYSSLEDGKFFVPQNGSGLNNTQNDSDEELNKVTARLETHLLQKIFLSGKFDQFKVLLARPGMDGTLKKRLKATNSIGRVFAKTGTLQHTKSLAGFVETKKGVMIFAIIGDKLKVSTASATEDIDNIVYRHAKYLAIKGM